MISTSEYIFAPKNWLRYPESNQIWNSFIGIPVREIDAQTEKITELRPHGNTSSTIEVFIVCFTLNIIVTADGRLFETVASVPVRTMIRLPQC